MRSEVTDPALTDLIDEIRQMRDVPVPEKDLDNAKKAIVGSFALLLESPNAILANYIDRHFYGLPADYWDTYAAKIEAVTAADIQRVAKKYWAPDRLQIVAVGDLAKVEPALKKLGAVKVFDAEGKPIEVVELSAVGNAALRHGDCAKLEACFCRHFRDLRELCAACPMAQLIRTAALIFSIASPKVSISSSVV